MSNNNDDISAAEKQALLHGAKVIDGEMEKLKDWVTAGPPGLRVLSFFGGLAVFITSLLHWSTGLLKLAFINIIIHSLLLIFGSMVVILEVKDTFLTRGLRSLLVSRFPFLGKLAYRGMFYIFIAALEFITSDLLPQIVAIYMAVMGIASITAGSYARTKIALTSDGNNEEFLDEDDRAV